MGTLIGLKLIIVPIVLFYVPGSSATSNCSCVAHLYCSNIVRHYAVLRILIGRPVTLLRIAQGAP